MTEPGGPAGPRRTLRGWFLLSGLALFVLAGWWIGRNAPSGAAPPAAAGARVLAAQLPDAEGRIQALARFQGRPLIVNFWATWCQPCVAELPRLDAAQAELAARGVGFVAIGLDPPAEIRAFRERLQLHLLLLAGGYESLSFARDLGDQQGVLPYTALLSADGRLLKSHVGALEDDELRRWIDQASAAGS